MPGASRSGKPCGAALIKLVNQAGRVTEREVGSSRRVETDSKTGQATVSFRIDDADGGQYLLRVAGTDRFNNPIVADGGLRLRASKDETSCASSPTASGTRWARRPA